MATQESDDLMTLAGQGNEHLGRLRGLLAGSDAPEVAVLKQAVASTRSLRGNASLLGLDPFQSFLGRVFQLLEDLESGAVPWSNRVETMLHEVAEAEKRFLDALERGEPNRGAVYVARADSALSAWRRNAAQAHEAASETPAPAGVNLAHEVELALQHLQRLRQVLELQPVTPAMRQGGLATLEREIATFQALLNRPHGDAEPSPETSQEGLRNHCEGALHHLVEAAAQEVLNEARERGLRLALRVTGALDPVDEGLGAALLEVLTYLWSDCLEAQAGRAEAQIDTVLRSADQRLVVEVRDGGVGEPAWRAARSDDDVLGCYPGLRRSRPLVEAVHGLVQVEPRELPGCRFRLSLPLSTDRPHAALLRVGAHDIAIAASSIDSVHATSEVRIAQDAAGAFVEAAGMRVPVLHLAFLLGDVRFDELQRDFVVVVGSFERRAAIFASDARRTTVGKLMVEAQGLWAGTLETDRGVVPMLHVGAVLGRCAPAQTAAEPVPPAATTDAEVRGPGHVVVVDSSELERARLQELLGGAGHTVHAVQTAAEAWGILATEPCDLLLCDLRLPEMNAQQIADRRRQESAFARVPMVLILAHAGEQSHLVVQQLGATAWVRSPLEAAEVSAVVDRHVVRSS